MPMCCFSHMFGEAESDIQVSRRCRLCVCSVYIPPQCGLQGLSGTGWQRQSLPALRVLN